MINKYFINVRSSDQQKEISLDANLYFNNTEYQILSGLINWERTCYHECLYELLNLHSKSPEYDTGFHPLDIVANFQKTEISNGALGTTCILNTKEFIRIIEESFLFRHYVRKGESSKELIRLGVNELFNKKPKHSIKFNNRNKVTVFNDLYEVDIFIIITEEDYENGVDDFISRINFESDLK